MYTKAIFKSKSAFILPPTNRWGLKILDLASTNHTFNLLIVPKSNACQYYFSGGVLLHKRKNFLWATKMLQICSDIKSFLVCNIHRTKKRGKRIYIVSCLTLLLQTIWYLINEHFMNNVMNKQKKRLLA